MKGGFKDKMYKTNNRGRGLEYRTDTEAYCRVPSGYAGYSITRYAARMPARDRYVRRAPIETREKAVRKYIYEKLIYGTHRASRYGVQ